LAELIQVGSNTLHSKIHILINSIWNKEKQPQQWKESIIVPIYKKGDKINCSNYRGIPPLPIRYKILSSILVSRLITYIDEFTWNYQCGFQCNRSTTDQDILHSSDTREKVGV